MKLHLGVIDQNYFGGGDKSTADVAQILEANYAIMGTFAEMNSEFIGEALSDSVTGAMESLLSGSVSPDAFASGAAKIEQRFREFLDQEEMAGFRGSVFASAAAGAYQVGGKGLGQVPTKAALRGVNHRLKHPYAKANPRRPSFIDTGLYEASFRAWVAED